MNKRLFIAIPLSKTILKELQKFQASHNQKAINWLPRKNLHITVLFLGQVSFRKVAKVIYKLEPLLTKLKQLKLKPERIILYPKKNPRMIWLKFENNYEAYRQLVKQVSQCLKGTVRISQSRRKITPHITLGRIRNKPELIKKAKLEKNLSQAETMVIKQVVLYHSELTAQGSTYEALCKFPLE